MIKLDTGEDWLRTEKLYGSARSDGLAGRMISDLCSRGDLAAKGFGSFSYTGRLEAVTRACRHIIWLCGGGILT